MYVVSNILTGYSMTTNCKFKVCTFYEKYRGVKNFDAVVYNKHCFMIFFILDFVYVIKKYFQIGTLFCYFLFNDREVMFSS